MNKYLAAFIAAAVAAFASCALTWQCGHSVARQNEQYSSLAQSFLRGQKLAGVSNIMARSQEYVTAAGTLGYYDLILPENARVFMTDMTGPANYHKIGYYYFITYYLFPREIGVSVDQPTRIGATGFSGSTTGSDQELLARGYDVRIDVSSGDQLHIKALRDLPMRFPKNPPGFDSNYDTMIAFLLPLLTALTGMWLLRFLFSALAEQMPVLEQLACGLGLGMMAVAALTFGVKLCGFHGHGLILVITAAGAVAELWRDRKVIVTRAIESSRKTVRSPVTAVFVIIGLLVFLILFRIAGLEGLVDPDAAMAWSVKTKIVHLYAGNDLVRWFSAPGLSRAHLDYPTLVPSLHSATYDSLGHVNEFVTRYWPTWMLFFLLGALASRYQAGNKWGHVPAFALLGLLLLPATQEYAHMEGSTMPMTFFTVLGFVQCTNWLLGKDPARLGLGLTFLFGGAMTHLEGLIFMALAAGWILLLPSARPGWKLPPAFWRVLAFWFLAALPYACLRVRIPSLHFESGWAGYALHHPGSTLLIWPCIFLIQSARMFAGPDWANWAGDDGQIHWIGKWDGLSSLYDPATLGLTWLCLLLTIVLWVALPARRRVIIWPLAMFFGAAIAFSGVFASLLSVQGLSETINYTLTGGRYLFPVLAAWYAAILTILFAGPPDATSSQATSPARMPDLNLAGSKEGGWLVAGACLILVLGIFVFPNHEPAAPENRLENAVPPSSPADSGTQVAGNPDLQARMERAVQLDKAGRFAESIQEYREVARLYPDDPMALNNLAWSLAANPRHELRNGREAVALASRAVELTGQQQAVFIGTLAAAYAEDGQFAKAVETAKLARTIALLKCQLQVAEINDQLLKLYSTGKTVGLTNGP